MIELTCILCPKGCRLRVDENDGYKVIGNACPRGADYGREEALDPKRTITSTVRILFEKQSTGTGGANTICASYEDPCYNAVSAESPESESPEAESPESESPESVARPVLSAPLPLVSYFRPDAPQIEARLPVKTSAPVPKASIMDVMREVNRITVRGPARLGDVIAANIAGTGVDLLATRTMTGPEGSR